MGDPALWQGRLVQGVELTFKDGKVVKATAEKNKEFLLKMLDSDPGAKYVGEFAIGTNFNIDRFTRNILFDEKLGGTFHMALGAGYPTRRLGALANRPVRLRFVMKDADFYSLRFRE